MSFVDTNELTVVERRPGWYGRYFNSKNMTFAYYDFKRGSSIHEHFHTQEEVWQVIKGELEFTVDGETKITRAGMAAIIPADVRHSIKALTDGRAIVVDTPRRPEFG
jgi:quercetin dioxygenase-like cupin family protein